MLNVLILNGSISGSAGNTQKLIEVAQQAITNQKANCQTIHLKDLLENKISIEEIAKLMFASDALIFSTGTYWDSWGSPLQFFLEKITPYEGHQDFIAKPVSIMATMHSVGGKSVVSRLQGVLNTIGFSSPPMSSLVYSLVNQEALKNESSFNDDFWSLEDLDAITNNLLTMATIMKNNKETFKAWPVDHKDPKRIWLEK